MNIKNDKAATLKSADNMADAKLEFASEKNWESDHSQLFNSIYWNK